MGVIPAGRRSAVHLLVLDIVVMLGLIGFGLGNLFAGAWQPPRFLSVWAVIVFLVLAGMPVVLRRFWPVAVFRVGLVAGVVAILAGAQWAVALDIGLALYVVVAEQRRRQGIRNLAAALAVTLLAPLVSPGMDTLGEIAFSWAVLIACAATGIAVQERRGRVEANMVRRERQAVAEERLRIARELHDVVAHSMSLITVKAAVANHVAAQHPEQAREALHTIEAASRDGLAELRRMLGVLRSEDDPDGELTPAPTVADLSGLVERAASAGVTMSLDVRGADALPDAVGLAVYRIVQEAVTNVVKHAAPANCAVTVAVADGLVRIEVADDGSARTLDESAGMPGHGLIGMRERVMTYAGSFQAGPRPGGGFTVTATLPFDARGTDRPDPAGSGKAESGDAEVVSSTVHTAASGAARVGERQVGDGQVGERQVSDCQVGDRQVGDRQVGDHQVGHGQVGDGQRGHRQLGHHQVGHAEVAEAEVIGRDVTDARASEAEAGEAGLGEAGLGEAGLGHGTEDGAGVGDVTEGAAVVGEAERSGITVDGIGVGVAGSGAAGVDLDEASLGGGGA
ncbi:MAG TPA: sensor histidine kinase [Pseudonocardiaceae bacterium]|nr:sensor histidine kinase [Pseudonocardiaceae bacterium]